MVLRLSLGLALVLLCSARGALAWTWPADGPVLRPFLLEDSHAAGQHRGIDIGGELDSLVRAPASGTVTFVGRIPTGAQAVTITTSSGYAVTLLQLGTVAVQRAQVVAEGATLGTIGVSSDPLTAQPHVHLGVRREADDDGYVDPLGLLPGRDRVPATPVAVAPAVGAAEAAIVRIPVAPEAAELPPSSEPAPEPPTPAGSPSPAEPSTPAAPSTPIEPPTPVVPPAPPTPVEPLTPASVPGALRMAIPRPLPSVRRAVFAAQSNIVMTAPPSPARPAASQGSARRRQSPSAVRHGVPARRVESASVLSLIHISEPTRPY